MKICNMCKEEKVLEEFAVNSGGSQGRRAVCKICINEQQRSQWAEMPVESKTEKLDQKRQWRQQNPEYLRNWNLQSKYGLSSEEWDYLFLSQGRRCAACHTKDFGQNGPMTDHNHITGQLRGILCHHCNIVVGYVENGWNVEVPAINSYLKRWESCRTKSSSRMVNSA